MTQRFPEAVDQQRELTTPPPFTPDPDGLAARVILKPDDEMKLTYVRTTDARTALARGLQEYIGTKSMVWEGGRRIAFQDIKVVWATPEDPKAKYPAAAVVGAQEAEYDSSQFTPKLAKTFDPKDGRYLRRVSELVQRFAFVIWSTDPRERLGLVAMVEDALEPAEFMSGLRLELPYYFGVRATYEKLAIAYEDSSDTAIGRKLRAIITLTGHIPQMVPVGDLKPMRVRTDVQVDRDT